MSHSTSLRIALFTRRFTLTPSRSPNFRRNSSTSRSIRIVRVTLLLGDNATTWPTGNQWTVNGELLNPFSVQPQPNDHLVLRFVDPDFPLKVIAERGAQRLFVERRPSRAAAVLEDDDATVVLHEFLIRERATVLGEQLGEPLE